MESHTKKLTLFKNNSLKIQYSTSQRAIAHWAPLKTSRWKGLSFICAFGLCFLIEGNSLVKLSQWCSIWPWIDMWFLSLLKHHNYCHFGFMDVLKRHGHLCTCCKIHHKRWETCHIMVQICEVHETSNTTMVVQLKPLFT